MPGGRAAQMNVAAEQARGYRLLFLHADTRLPAGYVAMVHQILDDPSVGRVHIAPATVVTSSRRWAARGVLRTCLLNQAMLAGYHLGVPIQRLARLYRGG